MSNNTQISNEDVEGLIAGDMNCLKKAYDCYKDRIYAYTLKLSKSQVIAEEVVQDVFVKVWNKRETINTDYSFSSFIFRVAHNHTINVLKRLAYDKSAKDNISKTANLSVDDTEDKLVLKEYMGLLKKAINELPPKRKNIFNLSRVKGVSHDEIAEQMGISKNTVKSQLVKATKSIRLYFLEYADMAI